MIKDKGKRLEPRMTQITRIDISGNCVADQRTSHRQRHAAPPNRSSRQFFSRYPFGVRGRLLISEREEEERECRMKRQRQKHATQRHREHGERPQPRIMQISRIRIHLPSESYMLLNRDHHIVSTSPQNASFQRRLEPIRGPRQVANYSNIAILKMKMMKNRDWHNVLPDITG